MQTPNPNPHPDPNPNTAPNPTPGPNPNLLAQRLRIKDVRRSEVLARYGEMPPDTAWRDAAHSTVRERARVTLSES